LNNNAEEGVGARAMMPAKDVVNGTSDGARVNGVPSPDVEVKPKKPRRRLTAAYKLRVLKEADKCEGPGEVGAAASA